MLMMKCMYQIIFQVPSNLVLKKIGANLWMSFLVTFTGIIVACSAAIKNGAGLLAVRFFLGIAETGVFPCSVYYFSIWYTRREQGKRFSIYYASAAVAGVSCCISCMLDLVYLIIDLYIA